MAVMDARTAAMAIEDAKKNEHHATCGTMDVRGDVRADGTIDVMCACGVMLRVKMHEVATQPVADAAKGETIGRSRRAHVNDKDGE